MIVVAALGALAGCANPVNRVTMEEYELACARAETDNRMLDAVQACNRAYLNTRIGNLGPEAESRALYNLGRVQKKALMLHEAEESLVQSLVIERRIVPSDPVRIGRRLAELATVLAARGRFREGVAYMDELAPIAPRYEGSERRYVGTLFHAYAGQLRAEGLAAEAARFEAVGLGLGFQRGDRP